MGIEPTRDLLKPHNGFEDRRRHQDAGHLHAHYTDSRCRGQEWDCPANYDSSSVAVFTPVVER